MLSTVSTPTVLSTACADITYLRLRGGFVYLVAVMDWYSRYVLSWRVSNTLTRASA